MKYIIFEGNGLVHPVLFGDHTTHAQISLNGGTPVAAGFVKLNHMNYPHCYGRSESLKLKSRGEVDETIIHRALQNFGTFMFMTEYHGTDKET